MRCRVASFLFFLVFFPLVFAATSTRRAFYMHKCRVDGLDCRARTAAAAGPSASVAAATGQKRAPRRVGWDPSRAPLSRSDHHQSNQILFVEFCDSMLSRPSPSPAVCIPQGGVGFITPCSHALILLPLKSHSEERGMHPRSLPLIPSPLKSLTLHAFFSRRRLLLPLLLCLCSLVVIGQRSLLKRTKKKEKRKKKKEKRKKKLLLRDK